jgi:hypothetical protein
MRHFIVDQQEINFYFFKKNSLRKAKRQKFPRKVPFSWQKNHVEDKLAKKIKILKSE